ncbi:hypothetical protein OA527_03870 [Pelagibacteraceae bacterium]|nr:hypothetical protein [Pelagibacteraceae bacterium]
MSAKYLKLREKEHTPSTKFQLSKFYRTGSTDIKGFSTSGTIECE